MADNPKALRGRKKINLSVIPFTVLAELSVALEEGAIRYGPYNWRTGPPILASDYYNASNRHSGAWWEGENNDPDSLICHLTKQIATLTVLRDAMIVGNWVDDRPKATMELGWMIKLNQRATALRAELEKADAPKG